MAKDSTTNRDQITPGRFEVRLQGELDDRWASWFDGQIERRGDRTTVVVADLADQAAIHGLLERVRDLGLPLISFTRVPDIDSIQTNEEETNS